MAPRRYVALLAGAVGLVAPLLVTPLSGGAASAGTPTGIPSVTHWGAFFGDQDGGPDGRELSPTGVSLPGPRVVEVASSNSTQYALLANGTVYAWGLGLDGQLGNDTQEDSLTTAVQVQFPADVTIAWLPTDTMPYDTGLAVDTAGHVWGWGLDAASQLCLGLPTTPLLTPVQLPFTAPVTAVAGAGDHALYDAGGTVYACGDNENGDLGIGSTAAAPTPVPVEGLPDRPVKALVAAFNNSGALMDGGEYLDWGYDAQGQLGDGIVGVSAETPVEVDLPGPVTQVVQGGSEVDNGQTLVLVRGHGQYGWGDDDFGQLGDGGSTLAASPVPFSPPAGVTFVRLATGTCTSYGLTSSGSVYSWGCGGDGEIGNGGWDAQPRPVKLTAKGHFISSTAENVVVG